MKIVESNGGPLLAISRTDLPYWGGVDELKFFKYLSNQNNDYDYICFDSGEAGMLHIGKFQGTAGEAIYINYPLPTFIVDASENHIFIVQINGAEPSWTPQRLRGSDFEKVVNWRDSFQIALKAGELVFFDAAFVESDLDGNTLSAIIKAGFYQCDWARQLWEGEVDMNFIRIMRQK